MKSAVSCILPLVTLASLVAGKSCKQYKIPVTVTSTNLVYAFPPFTSDFDVSNFFDTVTSRSPPPPEAAFSGAVTETATYTIGGTFCKPDHGQPSSKKDTVIIATHGLNFDRKYWDPQIDPDTYSFANYATDLGYSIFFYDRLGVGESSVISGYKNQISIQDAILRELTSLIKGGKYTLDIGKPAKVVLVGHSYGSATSMSAVASDPSIADALILTGFSLNTTAQNLGGFLLAAQFRIAAKQQPGKWRQLDTGYITPVDIYASVIAFFRQPGYDIKVAKYADANKAPAALLELLTGGQAGLPFTYTGPTLLISGKYDFIFCTSDCDGVLDTPAAQVFSQAKPFKSISFPGAAHGLNLGFVARDAYKEIFDFLSANGL